MRAKGRELGGDVVRLAIWPAQVDAEIATVMGFFSDREKAGDK